MPLVWMMSFIVHELPALQILISRNEDKYPNPWFYPCSPVHFRNFDIHHAGSMPTNYPTAISLQYHIITSDIVQIPIQSRMMNSIAIFLFVIEFGEE